MRQGEAHRSIPGASGVVVVRALSQFQLNVSRTVAIKGVVSSHKGRHAFVVGPVMSHLKPYFLAKRTSTWDCLRSVHPCGVRRVTGRDRTTANPRHQ